MRISAVSVRAPVALIAGSPLTATAAQAVSEKVIYSFLSTGNDGRQPLGVLADA
jgi:hypothetical protein